jgi:Tol biopolymer transport system component
VVTNVKRVLAVFFVFILITTVGILAGRTQADIDGTPEQPLSAGDPAGRNGNSNLSMISADGRYVTFQSYASNLVQGDTNHYCQTEDGINNANCPDVFVYDRVTGQTSLVSVSSEGIPGDNVSTYAGSISADGRYLAFSSAASNLVSGDTNKTYDIFVYDREIGEMNRVSVSSAGTQANRQSYQPSISADGRFVAFVSPASNLVAGDTNEVDDIFLHDRLTGETIRVTVSSAGSQANSASSQPSLSADGRYMAFSSDADNLVDGDANQVEDIFVFDRETMQIVFVSVSSAGIQCDGDSRTPSISADGRFVAFASDATNLVRDDTNGTYDIFIHDRLTGETSRVSVASDGMQANSGNFGSHYPFLTADGRFVTFGSFASNLVAGDTNGFVDIFVHDRLSGETSRASVSSDGTQADQDSYSPSSVSVDGRYVAFYSDASNLVPSGNDGVRNIYIHDRQTGQTERVSVRKVSPTPAQISTGLSGIRADQ